MIRKQVTTAILLLIIISGCLTMGQNNQQPTGGEGEIAAETVARTPSNATSVDYNQSVAENEYLRRAVQQAVSNSTRVIVTVPENRVNETKRNLQQLPMHTMDEAESGNWGYYIHYQNEIVRLTFAILD